MDLNPVAKALSSGISSALAVLYTLTAVADVPIGVHEWIAVVISFLTGAGLVYAVPNAKPVPTPAPARTKEEAELLEAAVVAKIEARLAGPVQGVGSPKFPASRSIPFDA